MTERTPYVYITERLLIRFDRSLTADVFASLEHNKSIVVKWR